MGEHCGKNRKGTDMSDVQRWIDRLTKKPEYGKKVKWLGCMVREMRVVEVAMKLEGYKAVVSGFVCESDEKRMASVLEYYKQLNNGFSVEDIKSHIRRQLEDPPVVVKEVPRSGSTEMIGFGSITQDDAVAEPEATKDPPVDEPYTALDCCDDEGVTRSGATFQESDGGSGDC